MENIDSTKKPHQPDFYRTKEITQDLPASASGAGVVEPRSDVSRFYTLDGLRGAAAIIVCMYHISILTEARPIAHRGYLTVDFFFLLSGFVLSHAYPHKFESGGVTDFIFLRAIRFFPLSIFGVIVGTLVLLIQAFPDALSPDDISFIFTGFIFNLMLLPNFLTPHLADQFFPSNSALWSLSDELLVNIFWASYAWRRSTPFLMALSAGAFLPLMFFTYSLGSAAVGWNWGDYIGGLGRAVFGFFVGVVINRLHDPHGMKLRGAMFPCFLALPAATCFYHTDPSVDLLIILFVLPTILLIASRTRPENRSVIRLLELSGKISYPLYAIHFPVLLLLRFLLRKLDIHSAGSFVPYSVLVPLLAIAWALDRYLDVPFRRILNRYRSRSIKRQI